MTRSSKSAVSLCEVPSQLGERTSEAKARRTLNLFWYSWKHQVEIYIHTDSH